MKPNCRVTNAVVNQAQSIIRVLETECDVWALKTRDIPIWWFVRDRSYAQLLEYFNSKQGDQTPIQNRNILESSSHLLSICSKAMIFTMRSLSGIIQITRMKARFRKGPMMFLSAPAAFRGVKGKGLSDIHLDLIYRKISRKSIVVERTTLSKWDFHSLLFRKDTLFFDCLLLFAFLKLFPSLLETPRPKGWHALCAKCQKIDFGGIPSDHLLDILQSVIAQVSRKVIIQVEASRMLLQKVNPKAVIETCSYDSASRALNLVARRHGIPIIEMQHGLISQDMSYNYFLPDNYQGEKPLPNRILIYGDASKRSILGMGSAFSSKNLHVVGLPRLSIFLKNLRVKGRDSLREKTREHLGIAQDIFVLTVTTQPTTSHCLGNFLEEVLKTIEENKLSICIKPHPREINTWKRSYAGIIQDPRVRILTDRDIDLYELLVASDVHATVHSTVFLECLALGVPNVIIGCPGYHHILELVDKREIVIVQRSEALVDEVKKLATDRSYRQAVIRRGWQVASRFFAEGNSPARRIIEEVEQRREEEGRAGKGAPPDALNPE